MSDTRGQRRETLTFGEAIEMASSSVGAVGSSLQLEREVGAGDLVDLMRCALARRAQVVDVHPRTGDDVRTDDDVARLYRVPGGSLYRSATCLGWTAAILAQLYRATHRSRFGVVANEDADHLWIELVGVVAAVLGIPIHLVSLDGPLAPDHGITHLFVSRTSRVRDEIVEGATSAETVVIEQPVRALDLPDVDSPVTGRQRTIELAASLEFGPVAYRDASGGGWQPLPSVSIDRRGRGIGTVRSPMVARAFGSVPQPAMHI